MMRNALIVTYVWPPFGHAPVQRVLRFCKYLPQFGWKPIVLTVANPTAQMQTGETGEGIMENLEVHRALTIEPPYALKAKLRDWLRKRAAAPKPDTGSVPLHAKVQVLDSHVGWVPLATLRGWPLIRSRKIDAIFVSAPPFSSLLIGKYLSKLTGCPLVVDFRDEWCGFLSWGYESGGGRNQMAERMESGVIRTARKVVSVSRGITANFQKRYPELGQERFVTIHNGFDPDDFPATLTAPAPQKPGKLRITFVGTIVRLTTARHFLQALAANPAVAGQIEAHFYGRITPEEAMFFNQPSVQGVVHVHGYLAHKDVPGTLCESDVLLVTLDAIPGAERVPTAKIFEYLAARRFILAIVPEGETSACVRTCGAGRAVAPQDSAALQETLAWLVNNRDAVRCLPDYREDQVQQFSRKIETKSLAAIFDEVCQPN